MESCTQFVKPMNIKCDDEELIICDTPGIDDTRGIEVDIANMYGICYAASVSKAVLPIIVFSRKGCGDKMTYFKD